MIVGTKVHIRTSSNAVYVGKIKALNDAHVAVQDDNGTYIVPWAIIRELVVL